MISVCYENVIDLLSLSNPAINDFSVQICMKGDEFSSRRVVILYI